MQQAPFREFFKRLQKKWTLLILAGILLLLLTNVVVVHFFPHGLQTDFGAQSPGPEAVATTTVVAGATSATVKSTATVVPKGASSSVAAPSSKFGHGTYSVTGKKIVDSRGNTFIPYGVQLVGCLMAQNNWRSDGALTYMTQNHVQVAHDTWHSNTVSLQLAANALFASSPYDSEYLTLVDQVVAWSKALNMNIILVLQDECYNNPGDSMPTQSSLNFWNILSQHYALATNVFFDLYNEPVPAVVLNRDMDDDAVWSFWQNGGNAGGKSYIGMQQLINTIRRNGYNNLIFADGTAAGEDIALISSHLLTGGNIVYAIHPYMVQGQHDTVVQWENWFGRSAFTGNFPVVADEWSYYVDGANTCLPNAATLIPQFLAYLQSKDIGVIAYALYPGTLIHGWNLTDPTDINQACPTQNLPAPNMSSTAQGAGRLLENYFATYSKQQ